MIILNECTMIVEFVFITNVSQFPQDVFERVKDNT